VACGSQIKNKKETAQVLCQEYVIRTETTEYHVRQEKPADKALIPVNTSVEFTLDKDKMKFKANGKKYEYLIVSESAAPAASAAVAPRP
jgi:bisphosphoglycerate-dependent phosphoglycerate mutase